MKAKDIATWIALASLAWWLWRQYLISQIRPGMPRAKALSIARALGFGDLAAGRGTAAREAEWFALTGQDW